MLDQESLNALREALRILDAGFAKLPTYTPNAPRVEQIAEALSATAERLKDNYPYFHPLYAGQMLKPPHPVARMAYALAMWINPNNHALDGGRATSAMEKEAVAEIAAAFGWKNFLGHLCGGGTMASLEALWVAGQLQPGKKILASKQAHYTHQRISGVLQLAFESVPTDALGRMDMEALAKRVERGNVGTVVATVGTTSTSSIDPVPEIVKVCEPHAMWLHVDAAYAGSAAIVPEMRHILDGCDRADSLVLNPHKWLFTPFDCSVLYCRRTDLLRRAFLLVPEYLRTPEQERVRSGSDYGVQLGRRFRALKLWMIIRYFGHQGLVARIREHCRLAHLFASWVQESAQWKLMAPTPFALVCFRACPTIEGESTKDCGRRLDALNEAIMHGVNATGKAFLSHTKLNDQLTLRLSIGNIRTTEKHVKQVWDLLNQQLEQHTHNQC